MFLNVERDPYCHQCHLKIADVKCLNCWRSFCQKCVGKRGIVSSVSFSLEKCPSCVQLQNSIEKWKNGIAFKPLGTKAINELFSELIQSVEHVPRLLVADHSFFNSKLSPEFKPFNLLDIRKRLKNNHYRCPEELIADLRIAYHILKASPKGKFVQEEIKAISTYIKSIINELKLADDCPYCIINFYENKEKWFISTCPWGHAIVLAQVKAHPLWPAKILSYNPRRKTAHLFFFGGSHQRGIVDSKSIFYARNPQDYYDDYDVELRSRVPKSEQRDFDSAIEELMAHIRKLKIYFPNKISLLETFKTPWQPSKGIHMIDPTSIEDSSDEDSGIIDLDEEELRRKALLGAEQCQVHLECVRKKFDIGDSLTVPNISQRLAEIARKERSIDGQDNSKATRWGKPSPRTSESGSSQSMTSNNSSPSCYVSDGSFFGSLGHDFFNESLDEDDLFQSDNNDDFNSQPFDPRDPMFNGVVEEFIELDSRRERVLQEHNYSIDNKPTESQIQITRDKELEQEYLKRLEENKKIWEAKIQQDTAALKKIAWCAGCSNQAFFFCCINAQYCSRECQMEDWKHHRQYHSQHY
ncbi:uncharacterized protein LOC141851850 isoform X2 [Brevipalpus obovatus]|uniref:uncharacterized protein LOC141851850 isoform X2 n=1 Tax=Brevipalpus obovatus TaxID=246614 RepID=UPI003D9E2E92